MSIQQSSFRWALLVVFTSAFSFLLAQPNQVRLLYNGEDIDLKHGLSIDSQGLFEVITPTVQIDPTHKFFFEMTLARGDTAVGTTLKVRHFSKANTSFKTLMDQAQSGDRLVVEFSHPKIMVYVIGLH